jgi:hypothetical protein
MTGKQTTIFHFRCPPQLRKAIEAEARRQVLTPSAYARRVIVRHLQEAGAARVKAEEEDARPSGEGASQRSSRSIGEAA